MSRPSKVYIILSALDRYARENHKFLAGPSSEFVRSSIPEDIEIVPVADVNFYPPPKSHVILCGSSALKSWTGKDDLNAHRGYVGWHRLCHTVATWMPIDCVDVLSYEAEGFGGDEEDDQDASSNNKDSAPTSRQNYRFWFQSDVDKLLNNSRRRDLKSVTYIDSLDPRHLDAIEGPLFFDIETHPATDTLQCFSFAGLSTPIYTVPIYDHASRPRVNVLSYIRALVRALRRCVVVGHNVSFDLTFLAHYHNIPWGPRIEDTMIMGHRALPEAEKSLHHAISYWINSPYHKGDGIFNPYNEHQFQQLLRYNAADVATVRAIWLEQHARAASNSALAESFRTANASIEPYMRAGFVGFEFDERERIRARADLSRRAKQLGRILSVLVGHDILPSSPQQLSRYLYDELKYPVIERTPTGAPSTGADVLYKLLLKYPQNLALKTILALRDLNKQTDMLQFEPLYRMEKR